MKDLSHQRDRDRAHDGPGVATLRKDDEMHACRAGVLWGANGEGVRPRAEISKAAYALQGSDDVDVMEVAAFVLSFEDRGAVRGIDQCGVEITFELLIGRDGYGGGDAIAVDHRLAERESNGGLLGVLLDGTQGVGNVVADKLLGSVDDDLRRVDIGYLEACAVFTLPLGDVRGGEAVTPAVVVPVVDVLAEDDDVG